MTKQPFRFTFFLLMCLALPLTATAQVVDIPDPNLRSAIEKALGKASGATITPAEMATLTSLDAHVGGISDLTGMEHATNLTELFLYGGSISDISPLAGLTNLTSLGLSENNISDISVLSGLTNLTTLNLSYNSISDISALSSLTNLIRLDLWRNSISDISAVAGLTNLTELEILGNSISDLSALSGLINLTGLGLNTNNISDLSSLLSNTGLGTGDIVDVRWNPLNATAFNTHIPALQRRGVQVQFTPPTAVTIPDPNLRARIEGALGKASGATITPADMATLIELDARQANISDLTGLEWATNLTTLGLWANNVSDISVVAGLTNLTKLNISTNSISDISPLAGLTNLTELSLYQNNISDISAVAGLTNLTWLNLSINSLSNISAVAGLTNLTGLDVHNNDISDISALSGLTNLTYLWLEDTSVSDISLLARLTNLTQLGLGGTSLSDVSLLAGLTNLIWLYLEDNNISDISALSGLINLIRLDLEDNNISDISALVSNTGLGSGDWVDVRSNPLNAISLNTHLPTLQGRGVSVEFDAVSVVNIPDPNLRAKIEQALGKASGATITTDDMATLTQPLDARSANISDLTGLEWATNLTELWLGWNNISNISALAGLTNLTTLFLNDNPLSDLSPLSGLTNLTYLNLNGSSLSNISALLMGLTNLTTLELNTNPLNAAAFNTHIPTLQRRGVKVYFDANIPDPNLRAKIEQALGKASGATITAADMATLTELDALHAGISDLTGLEWAINLTELPLGANSISDISPLAGLTKLTDLWLWHNSLSDISPLAGLTNLRLLNLADNSISDISPLVANTGLGTGDYVFATGNPLSPVSINTHIPTLQRRGVQVDFDAVSAVNIPDPNLRAKVEQALGKASGATITPADMATLTQLNAGDANVKDLTGLGWATNLTGLWLRDNSISDISALAGLTNLTQLYLFNNSLSDISALSRLTNLTNLFLSHNNISDISVLSGLTNLTYLNIRNNSISNISALAGLTNLTNLLLSNNNISDISVLSGLTNLTVLWLYGNRLSDLSPLVSNTGLGTGDRVDVRNNPLNTAAFNTHIPALQRRGVQVQFNAPALIPDPNLRAKIEAKLGKAAGATITPAEMATLTTLEARNANISDLTGLEYATNLTSLDLYWNSVSDISVLSGLTLLEELDLYNNSVSDISALSGLTNLTKLNLGNNSVSDISALSGLINLTYLYLWDNSASDISVLSGLTNLTELYLGENGISDISSLSGLTNLKVLHLWDNFVSDISVLSGLTLLEELNLWSNAVSDISVLSGLTLLEVLNLRYNAVSDISALSGLTNLTWLSLENHSGLISDISSLSGLTLLEVLNLGGNSVSDISVLSGLTNLTYLGLQRNSISDISALSGLTNLEDLWLHRNSISDISALLGLINLTRLWLQGNNISDLSPLVSNTGLGNGHEVDVSANPLSDPSINTHIPTLQGRGVDVKFDNLKPVVNVNIPDPNLRAAVEAALGKASGDTITPAEMATLTRLDAPRVNISDLTGLEHATNLTTLSLHTNNISDISAVAGLTNLTYLNLWDNSISDISAVAGLTNLTTLSLHTNNISDISAVAGLTNLTYLNLWDNSISDISAVAGLTNLTGLFLDDNNISDISAVAGLTNLTTLGLYNNSISDISVLSGLTNLTDLSLCQNNISDISVLSGLTNLTYLRLDNNSISDLSPLVSNTGLGTGDRVDVRGNSLSAVSHQTHIPTLQGRGVTVVFDEPGGGTIIGITGVVSHADGTPIVGAMVKAPGFGSIEVASTTDENGTYRIPYISFASVVIKVGDEITIEVTDTDDNVIERTHIVTAADISAGEATFNVNIPDLNLRAAKEFLLSVPAGTSLIHIPLKVTTVDGVEQSIESIADLYDALGGASAVNFLITYDSSTQAWLSYFSTADRGSAADRGLTDDMGIIAGMKAPATVRLRGDALGTNGSSVITLNQGLNLVGLPLRDSRITRVSDLLSLDGIRGNVPTIILSDGGDFKSVGRAGDPGDIAITGGQGFILTAQPAATVTISGEGWSNVSATAAAPQMLTGIGVTDTTPVLALRGSIVDKATGVNRVDLRVIVKNRSTPIKDRASTTGSAVTTVTGAERGGYQLTIVDMKTGRAAMIGDIFEISAQSPNPFIGAQPLRYTVTAEDVKRSWIQLPALVVYEIPAETELLPNYPNPFNPETWIPYRLAEDADVKLTIYDQGGQVVRSLNVGYRIAAIYESRSKAIYWDGRNGLGEQVASGVYFYHLSAGDYSATRRMVIVK